MLSTATVTAILDKVSQSGHMLQDGYNSDNFGDLRKDPTLLDEVANQKAELRTNTTRLPTFFNLTQFITKEPNFGSNELIIKKVHTHLESHGIGGFFSTESLKNVINTLTNHDLSALAKLYSCQHYSQAVDILLPSFYDVVFVIEDGPNMTQQYARECVHIMANTMLSSMLYDSTGVYIRTLNTSSGADELKSVREIEAFMSTLRPFPTSQSLGEQMYDKVYETVVKPTVGDLPKPVLLVVLSNSVPTAKDEVLESLERCRVESDHKMFLTFVNVGGSTDVTKYYSELAGNPHVTLVQVCTSIGMLVK